MKTKFLVPLIFLLCVGLFFTAFRNDGTQNNKTVMNKQMPAKGVCDSNMVGVTNYAEDALVFLLRLQCVNGDVPYSGSLMTLYNPRTQRVIATTKEYVFPAQSSNNGKVLKTNGTNTFWDSLLLYTGGTGISVNPTTGVITNNSPGITYTAGNGIAISSGVISRSKRQETYSGTTNVSGNYTVTFGTPYSVAPNIQANIVGGTALQRSIISSITTTGFTVQAVSQNTNTLLGIINLVSGTTVINGSTIDVLITEK